MVARKRSTAGIAAGVGSEPVLVGRIAFAAAETGIEEISSRGGVRGSASWAEPVSGGDGVRVSPVADAREVEDGEAGEAGPDRGGAADHVEADRALDGAAGNLVLQLLSGLGNIRQDDVGNGRRFGYPFVVGGGGGGGQ